MNGGGAGRLGWAIVLLAAWPGGLAAQAICSAPHSSPTLAQSGSIGTLAPGSGWAQVSVMGQRATELFDPNGDRRDFVGASRYDTRSLYLTAAVGVVRGVEVWGQLPLHSLRVEGVAGDSRGDGLGDVRAAVRVTPWLLGRTWPVAVRAGVKLPGSDFPVDATVLPLTEGQRDVELSLESGWASENGTVYVVGWVGQRWRSANDDILYEPGDERFAHLAVGGWWKEVSWELGVDGLWGEDPIEQGILLPTSDRHLVQLLPTVGLEAGPGNLDMTVPISLTGRNLPATTGIGLGYRVVWGG